MFVLRTALAAACALAAGTAGCGADSEAPSARDGATAPQAETAVAERERTTGGGPTATQAQGGTLRLQPVGRFTNPLTVTSPPGDTQRLFVVEQGGRVRLVRGGRVVQRPFLDVSRQIVSGGEQGLLGLAFPPDYARTRRFYVHFTDRSGDTRLVEYRTRRSTPDVADPSTARVVLRQDQPEANHNGGQLAFGPDGLLYMGLGDGGGADDQHGRRGNAQNLGTVLGKILRIDPRRSGSRAYGIPASNPFAGRRGARGEIYSYGLRNPWRFSFDRETGDLIIGDVGQEAFEEVDFVQRGRGRGANFGWRVFEGPKRRFADERAPGHVPPVLSYPRDDGRCSVIGGYVVRDPGLSGLTGQYLYADFCKGVVRAVRLSADGARDDRALGLPKVGSISAFGEDAQGRVYVVSLDGPVYRLAQG